VLLKINAVPRDASAHPFTIFGIITIEIEQTSLDLIQSVTPNDKIERQTKSVLTPTYNIAPRTGLSAVTFQVIQTCYHPSYCPALPRIKH
jgi:hypothetical protein